MDAGGPSQGGAVGAVQVSTSGSGTVGAQGEDLYTLEAEITELQRENARVESQVLRLRSDITAMENQLKQGDKVSCSVDKRPSAGHINIPIAGNRSIFHRKRCIIGWVITIEEIKV